MTITYSKFPANTKTTPANHSPGKLQPQHLINTSTNPSGGHTSNLIRLNKINGANEPL